MPKNTMLSKVAGGAGPALNNVEDRLPDAQILPARGVTVHSPEARENIM
jgi:hypothetical protein